MNSTTTPPHRQTPQTAGPIHQTASEDAFHVPPIESPAAPDGPDMSKVEGAEAGHHGPAYGDPTRHLGGAAPGKPDAQAPSSQPESQAPVSDPNKARPNSSNELIEMTAPARAGRQRLP
jgi:hypothetical protein